MASVWKAIAALLVAIYPIAIFYGLDNFEPKYLALLLGVLITIRYLSSNRIANKLVAGSSQVKENKIAELVFFFSVALIVLSVFYNSLPLLKLYPVLVNLSLLIIFSYSLYSPPTIIERFARLRNDDLSEREIIYIGKVTKLWIGFFIFNGSVAFYTAIFSSLEIWTLYNGLISYVLMGTLFLSELGYRLMIFKKN